MHAVISILFLCSIYTVYCDVRCMKIKRNFRVAIKFGLLMRVFYLNIEKKVQFIMLSLSICFYCILATSNLTQSYSPD